MVSQSLTLHAKVKFMRLLHRACSYKGISIIEK